MYTRFTRRAWLKLLGLATTNAFLVGCPTPRPDSEAINVLRATDPKSRLTIDTHCHVFNGSDLPMAPFATKVLVHGKDFPKGLDQLAELVQAIVWSNSPSANEEIEVLNSIRGASVVDSRELLRQTRQRAHANAVGRMRDAAKSVREKVPEGLQTPTTDPYRALRDFSGSYETDAWLEPTSASAAESPVAGAASAAEAMGALFFLAQLQNYRTCNVLSYLESMSPAGVPSMDLIVPSLVDFDFWLTGADDSATATSLTDQLRVMELLSVVSGGRVHALAPYDPLRDIVTNGASLKLVQDHVRLHGFMGVKIYPPMGFGAAGNAGVTPNPWKCAQGLPPITQQNDFPEKLDAAMARLLKWCCDEEVPVMAHTSSSNGQTDDLEKLAGPDHWLSALKDCPSLRIDFGHLGDTSLAEDGIDHAMEFAKLMGDGASPGGHAFADTGYFDDAIDNSDGLSERLKQLFAKSSTIGSRLMYGTDWLMNCGVPGIDRYRADFESLVASLELSLSAHSPAYHGFAARFFGGNAATFYGLKKGGKTRARLEAFYAANNIKQAPSWMTKVDSVA